VLNSKKGQNVFVNWSAFEMARKRRPSIPLIILFVILLLLFFLAGTLFSLALDFTGEGHIRFDYQTGSSTIISITHTLPQDLAEAMDPQPVTGWTVNLVNNDLRLTGGSLSAGQSVTVTYKLTEYITGGSKLITSTARTADGRDMPPENYELDVDTTVLGFMWLLYQNAIWFLILAIIVLVVIILLYFKGEKKNEEEPKKE
jgi:ABC-type sugar transport system permease subunit